MPTINTQTANTYSWLSSNSSKTNTLNANTEQFSVETKDLQAIKAKIQTWIDNPGKAADDIIIPNSYSNSLPSFNPYESGRISASVVWENSQKYSNVSEAQYNEAKNYLFGLIDDILLSTYLEEGDSEFFADLIFKAHVKNDFNEIDKAYKNIETSAIDFTYASKSGDAEQILKATTKLNEDIGKLASASFFALPNLIHFFNLADSKIPEGKLQKITNSLAVMQSYIENTLSLDETGSMTLKNGTIIRKSVDENDQVIFEVILPRDKLDGLISNYINENFQTLLQIVKQQENLLEKPKQAKVTMSDDLLAKLMKMPLDEKFGADIN